MTRVAQSHVSVPNANRVVGIFAIRLLLLTVSMLFYFLLLFSFFFSSLYIHYTYLELVQTIHNTTIYLTIQLQQGAKRKSWIKYNRYKTIIFYIFLKNITACV